MATSSRARALSNPSPKRRNASARKGRGFFWYKTSPQRQMTSKVVAAFEFKPEFAEHSQYQDCSITIERRTGKDYREVGASWSAYKKESEHAHFYQLSIRARRDGQSRLIGIVGCWNTPWGFYETHCAGLRLGEYRGEGWGTELYHQLINWALNEGIAIRSSKIWNGRFEISQDGLRVWNSRTLRKRYVIRQRNDRYRVVGLTES